MAEIFHYDEYPDERGKLVDHPQLYRIQEDLAKAILHSVFSYEAGTGILLAQFQ